MITAKPDVLPRPAREPATVRVDERRRRGRPDDALCIGSRVSSWRVDEELGRGGMSSVYAVVHTKFGKRAAIKIAHRSVLSSRTSAQQEGHNHGQGMSVDAFLREARIVHMVDHPAVIDVFATGSHDGRPYLAMEKLVGMPLGRRMDHGPPLTRTQAVEILLELCSVLRIAHAAGVVHRDLKLDNIFLCDQTFADGRRVKLLDWGVAYVAGEEDPFRGLIAGTLTYVAPEQIRGDAVTPAADIYSLAVLAYHLLCRRPPFAGADLALLNMHLRTDPPPPSFAWPQVPPPLEHLLVRMLAKLPEQRPSLDEVERVLRDCLPDVEQTFRFAEGSGVNIPVAIDYASIDLRPSPWYLRWLLAKTNTSPADDLLAQPILPAPPFRAGWIAVGLTVAALAGLINALS
jgi:serine/threonine-protein kinase